MSADGVNLIVGAVVLVLMLGFVFFYFFRLVPRIFKAALGPGGSGDGLAQAARGGGWNKLSASWRTESQPPERRLEHQWVQVGLVVYRRSVTVGAGCAGLYLETTGVSSLLGLPPLLIPWSAIVDQQPVRFQWIPAVKLTVASPADTAIVFYKRVFDELGMPICKKVQP